ncbi:hypothetical protein [Taklimakanibacter deserti]|uniref:hypothetical protein n=1 Tax=Taklimakanibacter deserti TaxID=2267839 RepID=UPI000E65457C
MQNAFNPAEIALFSKVVDEACLKLGCDDAERATIAARILSFAAKGTRDYETLLAVATFQRDALPH